LETPKPNNFVAKFYKTKPTSLGKQTHRTLPPKCVTVIWNETSTWVSSVQAGMGMQPTLCC